MNDYSHFKSKILPYDSILEFCTWLEVTQKFLLGEKKYMTRQDWSAAYFNAL